MNLEILCRKINVQQRTQVCALNIQVQGQFFFCIRRLTLSITCFSFNLQNTVIITQSLHQSLHIYKIYTLKH